MLNHGNRQQEAPYNEVEKASGPYAGSNTDYPDKQEQQI